MKKQVTIEAEFCDSCEENHAYVKCARCDKVVCRDCSVEWRMHVNYLCGDPVLCLSCNEIAAANPAILGPLITVRDLILERDEWSDDFERRKKEAEQAAESFVVQKVTQGAI